MKQVVNRDAPKEAPSSSSTPPPQVQLSGGQTSASRPIEMTRANLDQWKRIVRQQVQQKVQKLNSLQSEVNNLLKGMQEKIETVSASLQAYQGQPEQLALSLKQEFNIRMQTVQTLDTEISKTVQQVKELRRKMTAATGKEKTGPKVLKTGYAVPIKPCTVSDSELPSVQPSVLGFPVTPNQFSILTEDEVTNSELGQDQRLEDPGQTRAQRQLTSSSVGVQGTVLSEGVSEEFVPIEIENEPTFFNSLSVSSSDILRVQSGDNVQNLLETGVVIDDAMYSMNLNDVACTDGICNKRISVAGQEWSAGRPGNRPIGAREAARNIETCLGPYATRETVQPHTGHNIRGPGQASSRPRKEDQDNTNQLRASTSRRFSAAEDRASPAIAALHPRRPPYFCGDADDDIHVWTSIVDGWLSTVRGEPST